MLSLRRLAESYQACIYVYIYFCIRQSSTFASGQSEVHLADRALRAWLSGNRGLGGQVRLEERPDVCS